VPPARLLLLLRDELGNPTLSVPARRIGVGPEGLDGEHGAAGAQREGVAEALGLRGVNGLDRDGDLVGAQRAHRGDLAGGGRLLLLAHRALAFVE